MPVPGRKEETLQGQEHYDHSLRCIVLPQHTPEVSVLCSMLVLLPFAHTCGSAINIKAQDKVSAVTFSPEPFFNSHTAHKHKILICSNFDTQSVVAVVVLVFWFIQKYNPHGDRHVPSSFYRCCCILREILSLVLSSPTSPWPEFSLSVGGEGSIAHTNILWSFVVVLSSPAALLVGITPGLLGSTRKTVAMVTVSIRISVLERYM